MFQISKHCEDFVSTALRSSLPRSIVSQVTGILTYLKQQSLCDLDRRDSQSKIKATMEALVQLIRASPLDTLYRSNKSAWRDLEVFAGLPLSCPELVIPKVQKPKPRYAGKDSVEIARDLRRKAKELRVLVELEKDVLELGTLALVLLLEKPRSQRDPSDLTFVWNKIHRHARRQGMFEDLDGDPEAKVRLSKAIKYKPF